MRGWALAGNAVIRCVVLVVVAIAAVAIIGAQSRSATEQAAADRCRSVAVTFALDPYVRDAVQSANPSTPLQPVADQIRGDTAVTAVIVIGTDGTEFTAPDPKAAGTRYIGSIQAALAGGTFAETFGGSLHRTVRAVAPVFAQGKVVAVVSVALTIMLYGDDFWGRLLPVGLALAVAFVLVIVGDIARRRMARFAPPATGRRAVARRRR